MIWAYPVLAWVCIVGCILFWYRRDLVALWREPVLRYPVLIVESDDWGAGPLEQTEALQRLADALGEWRDGVGRCPVMTLAVVLAVPDGPAIRAHGAYHRRTLAAPGFAPLRAALQGGAARGVFALQLHAMEHYRPATLMASGDSGVRDWLLSDAPPATEALPGHLQSRWVDAGRLPSVALADDEIEAAVAEETACFAEVFGQSASVAVPPTFVWPQALEAAWARHGVEFVVTPGRRYACRDAAGRPAGAGRAIRNGERGAGVGYVVRDDYFEPERGHAAAHGLAALARKARQGRPCLLETHRSNFIGAEAERAFRELRALFGGALQRHPGLRFMSTREVAGGFRERPNALIDRRGVQRLVAWTNRWGDVPRFWTLARLTGLAPLSQTIARGIACLPWGVTVRPDSSRSV